MLDRLMYYLAFGFAVFLFIGVLGMIRNVELAFKCKKYISQYGIITKDPKRIPVAVQTCVSIIKDMQKKDIKNER